jgi:catechol 2,3-dioxygenase-like lactoylglutathione lyase family enzyme
LLPVQQAHAGIRVPVADLARSTRFYCDVLGLRITQQSAGAVRLDGFLSLVPDSDASLLPTKASPARWKAIIHVQTPSIAEVWANVLAFAGGAPTSIAFVGLRRYFRCEDPDGNIVEVVDVLDGRERDSEASPGQLGFSLDNGRGALRNRLADTAAVTLTPRIIGGRVLLSVTNHSESGRFAAQVTGVAGSEENVAVPWSVPWQDSTDEFRTIQREQTQLLVLGEADGMGFPLGSPPPAEWQPGVFWFETSSRRFRARLSNLRSTDDIYINSLSIRIEVRDAPGRIALSRELQLGFENSNDPGTGNLQVRVSISE